MIKIIRKIIFDIKSDRLGPDLPFTHWKLHFRNKMINICKNKFKHFSDTAVFRPGAYAVGCKKITIGKEVVIRPGVKLFGESLTLDTSIIIEDYVLMGCGVNIYINNHRFDRMDIPLIQQGHYDDKQVILKEGCWIGANAIILCGVTIGKNAVVGAGSIVTKSVPDGYVVAGNPARVIKKISDL